MIQLQIRLDDGSLSLLIWTSSPFHHGVDQVFHRPQCGCQSRFDRMRQTQSSFRSRLAWSPAEVEVGAVNRNRCREVFQLLGEPDAPIVTKMRRCSKRNCDSGVKFTARRSAPQSDRERQKDCVPNTGIRTSNADTTSLPKARP
jgi:hypothetical protein